MGCGGKLGSGVRSALLLGAAAVAPLWAQTDPCQPPSGDTGFAEIEANVFAGTFDKVLPFDVPLRLCTIVPQGTKGVRLRVASDDEKLAPDEASCVGTGSGGTGGGGAWGPAITGQVDDLSSTTVTTARIVVPRLDAQRYYAFCFILDRPLTAEEARQLQPEALAAIDREVAQLTSADLTPGAVAQLRARIQADLERRILAITGAEKVESGLAELVQEVIEPQLRARLIQQGTPADSGDPPPASLATLQSELRAALDEIRTSPALDRLLALLGQEGQTNVILRDLLEKSYAAAVRLAGLTDSQATAVATGDDPASPAGTTLASTHDGAAAAAAARRFDATSQALTDLADLIGKMTGPAGPAAVRTGLDAGDRAALAALAAPGGAISQAGDLAFTLAGQAQRLSASLAEREKALADFAGRLQLALQNVFVVDGSTTGNFDTFSNFYISADAGLTWSPEIDEVVPYGGTNIYLRPVNKNAPLRTLGSFRQTLSRRFAFTIGLTASSIADDGSGGNTGETRDDLFGSQSLLVGAGLRLTDMIRVGAGALVFKQKDPNPLIDDETTGRALYVSVSFDLDVARAFQGGLGGLFGPSP